MQNFGELYAIMSDEEKKSLITYLIKEIQIYQNGESEMPLKSIEFNFPIEVFDDIKIKVIKDSLSYVIMIAPYMKMFKGEGLNINTDLDLSIDIVNMDNSIKLAKGYFEFEGIVENNSVILRFNHNLGQ